MTTIQTPLGVINSFIKINEQNIVSGNKDFDLTFDLKKVNPALPTGMEVSEVYLLKWTLSSHKILKDVRFYCGWENDYTWKEGGPSTGEFLDAQTWTNGKFDVSIGTHDGEALALRSKAGKSIPSRFYQTVDEFNRFQWVDLLDKGNLIRIPELLEGEVVEIYFSIALSDKKDEEDISTWFACDLALPSKLE